MLITAHRDCIDTYCYHDVYRKRQVLDHCSQFERPPQRAQYCRYQTYSDALNFRSLDRERERETERERDRQTDRDRPVGG